jgi:hypothetical protein
MRYFVLAVFCSTILGGVLGSVYQEKLNASIAKDNADNPRAILGLVIDGHWMGACITSQDYKLHCSNQIAPARAFEIGKGLQEQSAMISNMSTPCGKQQDTKRDDTI